jgi:hypothetical protein
MSIITIYLNNSASNYFEYKNVTSYTKPGVGLRWRPRLSSGFTEAARSFQFFNSSSNIVLIMSDDNEQLVQPNGEFSLTSKTCPSVSHCKFTTDKISLESAHSIVVLSKNVTFLRHVAAETKKANFRILLLPNPLFHEKWLESGVDIKAFDALISYLPNSNIALAESMFLALRQDNSTWYQSTRILQNNPRRHHHKFKHCNRPHQRPIQKREAPSDSKPLVATILVSGRNF